MNKLGITIFMKNCTFAAEVPMDGMTNTIALLDKEIDRRLRDAGVTRSDSKTRVGAMMMRLAMVSDAIASNEIDQQSGASEIALGFIYAFVKQQGLDELEGLRGLVGCLDEDKRLYLNPCTDDTSYQTTAALMRDKASDILDYDDELEDRMPTKPTLH